MEEWVGGWAWAGGRAGMWDVEMGVGLGFVMDGGGQVGGRRLQRAEGGGARHTLCYQPKPPAVYHTLSSPVLSAGTWPTTSDTCAVDAALFDTFHHTQHCCYYMYHHTIIRYDVHLVDVGHVHLCGVDALHCHVQATGIVDRTTLKLKKCMWCMHLVDVRHVRLCGVDAQRQPKVRHLGHKAPRAARRGAAAAALEQHVARLGVGRGGR